ncbi:hypothetical protein TYRP_002976 [Tyrophagus putrescentiae]|nr:hypothetical protein TYRP_002976 [Tyrophagus putrescentiae]
MDILSKHQQQQQQQQKKEKKKKTLPELTAIHLQRLSSFLVSEHHNENFFFSASPARRFGVGSAAISPAIWAAISPAIWAAISPAIWAAISPAIRAAISPAIRAAISLAIRAAILRTLLPSSSEEIVHKVE